MKKILLIMFVLLLLFASFDIRASDTIDGIEKEIRFVLDRVSPSLVKVVAENGRKYVATGIAMETGFVITSTLVTRHRFEKLAVQTARGESIAARVVGQDQHSGLALLRLEKQGPQPLPRAGQARIGDWVALVGLFYDRFPAIFQGMISSLGDNELILNAPVAPGSVGGAVVNKRGELLGVIRGSVGFAFTPDYTFRDHAAAIMVRGKRSEGKNLCYAIPIEHVGRIAERLKLTGKAAPGWLGASFAGGSNQVYDVHKGSPAERAGIVRNDRIEEIAGKRIASFRDIASAIEFRLAGERIDLALSRAGKPLRLRVELGERRPNEAHVPAYDEMPEPPEPYPPHLVERLAEIPELPELEMDLPGVRNYVIEFAGSRQLGIDVMEISPELGEKFAVKEGHGLLISSVNEGSAAGKGGLKAGDIIVRANNDPVRNTADLRAVLDGLDEKEAVLIVLYRDGRERKFSLIPDRNEKRNWDMRCFSRKMGNLKEAIGGETRTMFQDEIRKLRREKLESLKKIKEENRKLALELKQLQEEQGRLSASAGKKYAAELERIREEVRAVQEKIRSEAEQEAGKEND